MTRLTVLAVVAALAGPGAPPSEATAFDGLTCGVESTTLDPDSGSDHQIGAVHGGPIVHNSPLPALLLCTVIFGGGTHRTGGTSWAGGGSGVAFTHFAPATYDNPKHTSVFLCTRLWIANEGPPDYYFDASAGRFSTSPDVPCAVVFVQEMPPSSPTSWTHVAQPQPVNAP